MTKYENVSEEIQKVFNSVLNNTTIPQWVVFGLKTNDKQKKPCIIRKNDDLYENLTNGLNFVIIVNEEILDQLDEKSQKIVFDECLAGVTVSDSDVVGYAKPDFTTYSGVLEKYGHDEIILLKESVKSLYDVKKEREAEEKENKKKK